MTQPKFLPFALPDISGSEIDSVVETLRSGWITTGPKTKEFEQEFAKAVQSPHAVMVNSCTAALHLALEAIGVTQNDEVIIPSMTFAATAEVVRYLNARPVIVDVRPSDHNISVEAIEDAITSRTRAVMPVHFAGQPCDMDEITELARRRGLLVVADSAHCFPGSYKGRNVGTLADLTCFSFYATKTISTGEGGAAVTANPDWADRMRIMALHGISRDAWKRYAADGSWYYEITAPGYKYNLTDIASAIGIGQLARAEEMRTRRESIADAYDDAFGGTDTFETPTRSPERVHAHHLYVLKLNPEALAIGRDRFIVELKERGIGTSVHFIPLHMHPYYRKTFGYRPEDLPVARALYERSVSLPIYSKMTDDDVARVIEAVRALAKAHQR